MVLVWKKPDWKEGGGEGVRLKASKCLEFSSYETKTSNLISSQRLLQHKAISGASASSPAQAPNTVLTRTSESVGGVEGMRTTADFSNYSLF